MLKDVLVKSNEVDLYMEKCKKTLMEYKKIIIWGAARGGCKLIQFMNKQGIDKDVFSLIMTKRSKVNCFMESCA